MINSEGRVIKEKLMDILACPAIYLWKCAECGYIHPPAEDKQICTFNHPPKKCPKCGSTTFESGKFFPLELHVFEEKDEIVEGMIVCPKCQRWFPIRDEIPELLPDELREARDERPFLRKWKDKVPEKILSNGRPFSLKKATEKKKN